MPVLGAPRLANPALKPWWCGWLSAALRTHSIGAARGREPPLASRLLSTPKRSQGVTQLALSGRQEAATRVVHNAHFAASHTQEEEKKEGGGGSRFSGPGARWRTGGAVAMMAASFGGGGGDEDEEAEGKKKARPRRTSVI